MKHDRPKEESDSVLNTHQLSHDCVLAYGPRTGTLVMLTITGRRDKLGLCIEIANYISCLSDALLWR
jgi:hypothetical protein